jgi:hypothetical protein
MVIYFFTYALSYSLQTFLEARFPGIPIEYAGMLLPPCDDPAPESPLMRVVDDEVLHFGDVILGVILILEELGDLVSVPEKDQKRYVLYGRHGSERHVPQLPVILGNIHIREINSSDHPREVIESGLYVVAPPAVVREKKHERVTLVIRFDEFTVLDREIVRCQEHFVYI